DRAVDVEAVATGKSLTQPGRLAQVEALVPADVQGDLVVAVVDHGAVEAGSEDDAVGSEIGGVAALRLLEVGGAEGIRGDGHEGARTGGGDTGGGELDGERHDGLRCSQGDAIDGVDGGEVEVVPGGDQVGRQELGGLGRG